MPRKIRIHYSQAFYHVMLRGNYKQRVFDDNEDYQKFYSLLESIADKYRCKIHLFCLMTNHIHLVIEISTIPLWKIMQSLSSCYSKYRNRRLGLQGHLFQGRYLSKIIENDRYLIELCYYIHFNPVKAHIVTKIDDYTWSSHLIYAGVSNISWVSTEYVTDLLSKYYKDENYLSFIKNKMNAVKEETQCKFDENGLLIIRDSFIDKFVAKQNINLSHLSLEKIAQTICARLSISYKLLSSENQGSQLCLCRSLIAYFAHYYGNYYIKEIARIFLRHPDSISKVMHSHLNSRKHNILIKEIERDLVKLL